ncbi:hypothetical protein PVAP13_7NG238634 [Panicum virgatum]|uniref:Uncharacterized protein n=1 Tax=Panicum virgatum TaxID=38727 RepID=A0A8T0Q2H9_PANVG|nr:hypothetical protein PVAP13_7NG238634 [Panicum virgatum]
MSRCADQAARDLLKADATRERQAAAAHSRKAQGASASTDSRRHQGDLRRWPRSRRAQAEWRSKGFRRRRGLQVDEARMRKAAAAQSRKDAAAPMRKAQGRARMDDV